MGRGGRFMGAAALGTALLIAISGCVPAGGDVDPYTTANLKYGVAPQADPAVTLQPEVVLIGGGGASVRGVSADGFTWLLDPKAPNADKLEVGSVMFVTSRGVGRVIDVQEIDSSLAVTIGPVEITDVIRDGDFASDAPVDFGAAIVQDSPGAFWADPDVLNEVGSDEADLPYDDVAPEDVTGTVETTSFRTQEAGIPGPPSLPRPALPPAVKSATKDVTSGAFNIHGKCCSAGVGADFTYDKNGLRMIGALAIKMASPKAKFAMKISGGTLESAEFLLSGGGSIHTEITAATAPGPAINAKSQALGTNLDFSIPVATVLGIPFSITVSQNFQIEISIPGTAEIKGTGDYKLSGQLGFTYAKGSLTSTTGGSFDAGTSVSASSSLAVGVSALTMDYRINFRLGIGLLGFTAGLDFGLNAHSRLTYGAPFGYNLAPGAASPIEYCKSAQGSLWVSYGFGYSIPQPIVKVVNFFLKYFNTTPIEANGGSHGDALLASTAVVHPNTKLCR